MKVAANPKQVGALVKRAKVFAALSATFDPKAALQSTDDIDQTTLITAASELAAGCDTNPDEGEGWLLRTSQRRYILKTLSDEGQLQAAIADRRATEADEDTKDLLLALEGKSPFSRDEIAADLQAEASEERLRRIVTALDRSLPVAPAGDLLQTARSTLAELVRGERRKHLQERGFFGRQAEQSKLTDWLTNAWEGRGVQAAFLTGLPGIGKSALIEEMVWKVSEKTNAVTVRLDFDRAGLNVLDVLGMTMEVSRQLGERLGDVGKPLLEARLAAAGQTVGEESVTIAQRSAIPDALGAAIMTTVAQSNRPVTLVLDTLEVLRARGEKHPQLLFEWIDQLVDFGMKPLRVIAAGRGDVLDNCNERVGVRIDLAGLDDDASKLLLDRLGVAPKNQEAVLRIADGNPLVLRLAGDVVNQYGTGALPAESVEKDVTAAFLYRFLLSRIDDPVLRDLAHPGLVTRRISADLLREVLAPILAVAELTELQAVEAFNKLAVQHWLVTTDPLDPNFVIHRGDMRLALLPLLYRDKPELCAKIDAAAVTWFGKRSDQMSQLDAAYHRLQLLRTRKTRPMISDAIANRFDEQMLAELPPSAQQIVLRARGGRTAAFRSDGVAPARIDDKALAAELIGLIDRQDWAEGQYVVDRAVEAGGFDPRSQAADAVRAFYWRAGKWHEARRMLQERDRLGASDSDLSDMPWPLALARLEMRAEFAPARLRRLLNEPVVQRLKSDFMRPVASPSRHGALAFIIARTDEHVLAGAEYGRDADPVSAAFEHWAGRSGSAGQRAIEIGRERLASRGASISPDTESNLSQLLAVHSPHGVFVANLTTQGGYEWLLGSAGSAAQLLANAGALFSPPAGGSLQLSASSPVADLAGLGLFAEWADAVGFVERDPNLRAIGRSAERWRQTMGGRWRYLTAPSDWRQQGLDATLMARVEAVRESQTLEDQLALWPGRGGRTLTGDELRQRVAGSLREAAKYPNRSERAARLLRWNVPSAFVPMLAVELDKHATDGGING